MIRNARSSSGFLAVGFVLIGVYFLLPGLQSFGYDVFGLAAVVAIAIGLRRHRPRRPSAWVLFGGGLLLFVAGDLVLSYYDQVFGTQPFPSVADASYLAGYVLLTAGLFSLIRSRAQGADRGAMIDALVVALGLGIVAWAFWMDQYADDASLTYVEKLISLAYPVMDIVLLGSVVLLAFRPGVKPAASYLLGLSLVALLGADMGYGLTTLSGTYTVGNPVDAGYLISYLLWGAAALHPSMRTMSEPAPKRDATLTHSRIVMLAMASLIGPLVVAVQTLRGVQVDVALIAVATGAGFLLVLARMSGLMRLLAETSAKRALATVREQTLRGAAALLVGAPDRETIYEGAADAISTVVGGGERSEVTVWALSGDQLAAVAAIGRSAPGRLGATLDMQKVPKEIKVELAAGQPVDLSTIGPALRDAVDFHPEIGVGFAVPVLVAGEFSAVFTVLTERPLDREVKGSLLTLRDQVVLALETDMLTADLHRRRGERRFAALIEHSSDVITILGDASAITYQTPSVQRVLGYDQDELTGTSLLELVHPEDRGRAQAVLSEALIGPGVSAPIEWRTLHRNGSWRQCENVVNNLRDDPDVGAIVLDTRDITERKQLEEQLAHQAFHDGLTDLPNRALFRDRAKHAVERSAFDGDRHAVLFLDLDDFKRINDSLGHSAGDQLLVEVAERLRACCRRSDTASRIGGDEFAVLLETIADDGEATRAADRIAAALREPFFLDGQEVLVSASIGIAIKSGEEQDAGEILRNADLAMYLAKSRGKARCEVFEPGMQADALARLELESDLRHAVDRQEFFLQYQPIIELDGARITAVEALLRWRHPSRGVIAPLDFIPTAEQTGLIVPIGRWVLQEACRRAADWQESHFSDPPLTINVNLSGRQLHDPSLVADVEQALSDAGLASESLTIEITETVMMTDTDATIARLQELTALGVRLAVDDFGTGYSSLSYLRRFPVDILKIDKTFVDDLAGDSDVAALADGIVKLGRALNLQVIAEGIESDDQMAHLRRMGCDMGQGYRFAKPMDGDAIDELLASHEASPSSAVPA